MDKSLIIPSLATRLSEREYSHLKKVLEFAKIPVVALMTKQI